MQKNGMWLPVIASIGVGAATYYSMTKNNQNIGQTMQNMVPLVSQMSAGRQQGTGMSQTKLKAHSGALLIFDCKISHYIHIHMG